MLLEWIKVGKTSEGNLQDAMKVRLIKTVIDKSSGWVVQPVYFKC